jgi:hypothetical protein
MATTNNLQQFQESTEEHDTMENTKPSPITALQLAQRYKSAVEEEVGLLAKIDEDNDVIFKYPDLGTMFFSFDAEKDPEYLMLVFPNFADRDDLEVTREQLLLAINAVNTQNKAVKLGIRADSIDGKCDVIATIECFLGAPNQAPSEELLRAIMRRNLSALRGGVHSLLKETKKFSAPAGSGTQTI